MVRVEVLRKRLAKLDEYLGVLDQLAQVSRAVFVNDPMRYGSAERFLHLSIETVTDMAHHVVADLELGSIDQYRDAPRIFAEQGWIEDELEERWLRMVGFRTILVHDYLDVDRDVVCDVLQNDLADLRSLQRVFAQFL